MTKLLDIQINGLDTRQTIMSVKQSVHFDKMSNIRADYPDNRIDYLDTHRAKYIGRLDTLIKSLENQT